MAPGDSTGDHTETSVLSIKWYFVVVVVVVVVEVVVCRLTCLLRVMWWDWAVSRQADKDSPPGWSLLSLSPALLCSQAAGEDYTNNQHTSSLTTDKGTLQTILKGFFEVGKTWTHLPFYINRVPEKYNFNVIEHNLCRHSRMFLKSVLCNILWWIAEIHATSWGIFLPSKQ